MTSFEPEYIEALRSPFQPVCAGYLMITAPKDEFAKTVQIGIEQPKCAPYSYLLQGSSPIGRPL